MFYTIFGSRSADAGTHVAVGSWVSPEGLVTLSICSPAPSKTFLQLRSVTDETWIFEWRSVDHALVGTLQKVVSISDSAENE